MKMLINYIGSFLLIVIGLAIMISKKNLVKIVIGMGVLDSGINLLLISIGYRMGGTAPIFYNDLKEGAFIPECVSRKKQIIPNIIDFLEKK